MTGENVARRTAGSLSDSSGGCGNRDEVVIVLVDGAVDPVALRKERVEALYQNGVAVE